MAPPVARRAPYKDFLQPWMQRRFASALLMLLATSYVESVALSSWDSLIWSWFPVGFAGFRALSIFGCVLLVIVLRIAHPHVGIRTTNSPMETFRQNIVSLAAFETIVTYTVSAFFFSQIYLWTVAEAANLQWITYHSGDRARLNERTVFYTLTLSLLGAFEGLMHLVLDYDSLSLGLVKASEEGAPNRRDPFEILLKSAPQLAGRALTVAVGVAVTNYICIYSFFLRHTAWAWTLSFFRPFYNLPKSNIPPSAAPWSIWMLGRSIVAGTLLCLLWNFGNAAFSAYLATEPLKHGQPLTSESKDPNGSLLNGLKSKKSRIAVSTLHRHSLITLLTPNSRLPCGSWP
jgi:nucleoporin NDC1